jgi:phosphatidylserine/phosphatidylglycerophosphate/cardiolipin synthase-like enzyme
MANVFAPIVSVPVLSPSTTTSLVTNSKAVPSPGSGDAPRFAGEPLYWVRVDGPAAIQAFARATVRVFTGVAPIFSETDWTLYEVAPLPSVNPAVFHSIPGGLPVQYILVPGKPPDPDSPDAPIDNFAVGAGELIVNTAGTPERGWFAIAFQDRITRDPALWPSNAALPAFALPNLRLLDHVGHPLATPVNINGTPVKPLDGDSGMAAPPSISFDTNTIVAGVDRQAGAFGAAYALAAGERYLQLLDADAWYAVRDSTTSPLLARWRANSHVEPIVDGTPYFTRLVPDLRSAKGGGSARLAGWIFLNDPMKEPWPLIPDQDDTELISLIRELNDNGADVRVIINKLLKVEQQSVIEESKVVAAVAALALIIFIAKVKADPKFIRLILLALGFSLLTIPVLDDQTPQLLESAADLSAGTADALKGILVDNSVRSHNPVSVDDNPFLNGSLSFSTGGSTSVTVHSFRQFGTFHQKLVVIQPAGNIPPVGYLGGIDINSDRIDTPLHHAAAPFHDVQVRVTGPAVDDMATTFAERWARESTKVLKPIAAAPDAGSHLVQIARTYPLGHDPASPLLSFAPNGERLIYDTLLKAIANAREFIYIEDQYFTPNDEYVRALLDAAGNAKALIITVPIRTDQLYGPLRRTDIFAALAAKWKDRIRVGVPMRRFLDPAPELASNEGRCRLAKPLKAGEKEIALEPPGRVPDPPFWAFVDGELIYFESFVADGTSEPSPESKSLNIRRSDGTQQVPAVTEEVTEEVTVPTAMQRDQWRARTVDHPEKAPVLLVNLPGIYVHAKLMIIDDVFLSVGSANLARRSFFHDGEVNAFVVPQHLKGDPVNPARRLRCELMAEHFGLPIEMGYALFADPLGALPYFDRNWYDGTNWQRIVAEPSAQLLEPAFLRPDYQPELKTASRYLTLALSNLTSIPKAVYSDVIWKGTIDPITKLDPDANPKSGPHYP